MAGFFRRIRTALTKVCRLLGLRAGSMITLSAIRAAMRWPCGPLLAT